MLIIAVAIILLGAIILAFGTRIRLLSTGIGALLGIGILRLVVGTENDLLWIVIPVVLAVLFAVAASTTSEMVDLVTLAIGAFAGGSIVLALLDLLGVHFGTLDWVIALAGAVVGAGLVRLFKDWAYIVLIAVIGALLVVRGLEILIPSLQGPVLSVLGLIIAVIAVAWHGGFISGHKRAVFDRR